MTGPRPPRGYTRVDTRGAIIVARADFADAILAAFRAAPSGHPTLHGYASHAADATPFKGRETAYGLTLPGAKAAVVVRHNRHGGAFRALTGDLFLGSTRAPLELANSLAIAGLAILTPPVVGYAIYSVAPGIARSDVVTERIPDSTDLGEMLISLEPGSDMRRLVWAATAQLVQALSVAGARHHDLNMKNVLIRPAPAGGDCAAFVLDVDRVELGCDPRTAYVANRARLLRSVEKWRRTRNAVISESEASVLRADYLKADAATTSS